MVAHIDRDLLLVLYRFFQDLVFYGLGLGQITFKQGEQQRVKHDRQNSPGQHQITAVLRHHAQRDPKPCQDEGKLANLRQAGGDGQRGAFGVAEHFHQQECGRRFTEHDNRQRCQHRQRLIDQDHRIKQHADRDKEQYGEGIAQR
ncbi:hypothetical protein D3C78_1099880 [compost metagenome]